MKISWWLKILYNKFKLSLRITRYTAVRGQMLTISGPLDVPFDAHCGECGRSSTRFRPLCSSYWPMYWPAHSAASAVERVLVFETSFSLSNELVSNRARAFYTRRVTFLCWFKYSVRAAVLESARKLASRFC